MNPWSVLAWTAAVSLAVLTVAINTAIIVAIIRSLHADPKPKPDKHPDHVTILSSRHEK
jgi:hypothetical protein